MRTRSEEALETVTIEITGLSLYTHHGVSEAEREVGQRLLFDLRLDVGETDATVTDRIEDTVDYGEVCQLVALIAQQRSHKTLERLCSDDRRSPARGLRARRRMGEGRQARAADPAAGGRGLSRGLARGRGVGAGAPVGSRGPRQLASEPGPRALATRDLVSRP